MNLFKRNKKASNHVIWKVVGGVALAALAAGVITNFQDIRRYIRISTM